MNHKPSRRRPGFTFIELLLVIAVMSLLMGLLLPAIQRARDSSMRMQCSSQLRQFGLAIQNYHDIKGGLLPSHLEDNASGTNTGQATWAVLILPFIDQEPLYDTWDLSKTYNAQTTFNHAVSPSAIFYCPARRGTDSVSKLGGQDNFAGGLSDYAVPGGDDGTIPGTWYGRYSRAALIAADCSQGPGRCRSRTKISSVSDGMSNTALLGEKHVRTSRYGQSDEDNSIFNGASILNHIRVAGPGYELATNPDYTTNATLIFGSSHLDICNFLMGDGSVRALRSSTPGSKLRAIMLRDDGESVSFD